MNLTEHLEHVIRLVERPATQSEIKGACLAMQEEVSGYEQAAANQVAVNKKHADEMLELTAKNQKLEAQLKQCMAQLKLKQPKPGIPPLTSPL
jgi:hypothetical protein